MCESYLTILPVSLLQIFTTVQVWVLILKTKIKSRSEFKLKVCIYLCYHSRDVTTIFKLQTTFHFVKNTTLQVRLELETTSTEVSLLGDCAPSDGYVFYDCIPTLPAGVMMT